MKNTITKHAIDNLKLSAIGFASPLVPEQDLKNYSKYLEEDNHGVMEWLKTRYHLRENPKELLDSIKTIIVVGANYFHKPEPKDYEISIYANQNEDYHLWLYKKISLLADFLKTEFADENRIFVDSGPVLEKVFAKQTSVGWQGKHTCIVSKDFGSWLFLGVILSSLDIEKDSPHKNFCGTCTKCIDACPTKALKPYELDVKKCISYATIEDKKNLIAEDIKNNLGKKIFGCDECLKACPFNKWQQETSFDVAKENLNFPDSKAEFLNLSEDDFKRIFKNTPLKRTGYTKLLQNINSIK